jgi:hypothetical protein
MTKGGEKDLDGQRSLKKAIIIFAIVEALVMAAVVLYTTFRR